MDLAAHGISLTLPPRWEGAIAGGSGDSAGGGTTKSASTLPVVHLATAALPADRGDFGSGAVDVLGPDDAFIALVEYGPECVGTAAFPATGLPRRLHATDFNRRSLQRAIPGQAGHQSFFTAGTRAFALYVVVGRDRELDALLADVNATLQGVKIA